MGLWFDFAGLIFHGCQLSQKAFFFKGLRVGGFAFGLELFEFFDGAFHGAGDALFVEREELHVVAFFEPDAGLPEGGIDLRVVHASRTTNGASRGSARITGEPPRQVLNSGHGQG